MRFPEYGEDLIGKVCVCSMGRLGLVVCRRVLPWGMSWCGVGLDGQGYWTSREPAVIFEDIVYYENALRPRNGCGS